jgi:signal transduction histidine kinase
VHDLRTPLTPLRARTELVLTRHSDPSPYRSALKSGLECSGGALHSVRIDLKPLLEPMQEMMAPSFIAQSRTLSLRLQPDAIACGGPNC